jgi:hypothetical protein
LERREALPSLDREPTGSFIHYRLKKNLGSLVFSNDFGVTTCTSHPGVAHLSTPAIWRSAKETVTPQPNCTVAYQIRSTHHLTSEPTACSSQSAGQRSSDR